MGAILDLHGLDVEVAPTFALAGMGCPSLRNCHGSSCLVWDSSGVKRVIVESVLNAVKDMGLL
jgi:hypothetical protein